MAESGEGQVWAEAVELGVIIDPGAPLPHLVTAGSRAVLVFHAAREAVPAAQGMSSPASIDPADSIPRRLGWVVFEGVRDASLGGPDDEGLPEHHLYGAGLEHYQAHEVRPAEAGARRVIITFHDETFNCVCKEWSSGSLVADFRTALALASNALQRGAVAFDGREMRSTGSELHPEVMPFVQLFWNPEILVEAVEDANDAGWEIVRLNAEGWNALDDMHSAFAQALSFPGYYGRNLDALDECMGDVVRGDYGFDRNAPAGLIVIDRFDSFFSREPRVAQILADILARAGIGAVRRGWQLAIFFQSNDPALQLEPLAAQRPVWNPKEWLNSKRGL